MLERFKRGHDEESPARTGQGEVATTDRPAEGAGEDTAVRRESDSSTEDSGLRRDSGATTADSGIRRESGATTADDRTTARRFERDERPAGRAANGVTRRDETARGRTATTGTATAAALDTARARQRDEFGGINWGASFFGWLVAVGVATLLTALLAAAGAAVGLTATTEAEATANAEELSLGGGIALVIVLMIAYYAGGYVAGRMSRFDGGRQGLGTWAIGLVVTILLAGAAVILGDQYNVLDQLNLPSLPVGDETLATGAIIALAAIVLGSLLAAMTGGKVGERYHKRVDRAGFID